MSQVRVKVRVRVSLINQYVLTITVGCHMYCCLRHCIEEEELFLQIIRTVKILSLKKAENIDVRIQAVEIRMCDKSI